MPFLPSPISCALKSSSESVGLSVVRYFAVASSPCETSRGSNMMRVDCEHVMDVRRRELALLGDDLDHHLAWPLGAEHVEDRNHRAEEQRAEPGDGKRAEAGGHAEAHQDEEDRDVAGVLDRRAEADDAGGAGDAEGARHRVADDDHHERAGDAEQHLRLIERRIGAALVTVLAVHDRDEHADHRRCHQLRQLEERMREKEFAFGDIGDAGNRRWARRSRRCPAPAT